jgi:hypothetical protein
VGIKFTFPSIIISCAQVAVMDSSYFSSPKTAAELFPIKFHLPPSSTSSESSGSDTDCKAEATSGSSNLVPGIKLFLPAPWSTSSSSCTQSDASTPIVSNTVFSNAIRNIGGLELSPINCKVLSYSKKSPHNTNRSVVSREMNINGSSPLRSIREGGSDDESLLPYVASDNESVSADAHPIPAVHGEVPSDDDCINPDSIDLSAIAQSMFESKNDVNYSEEEMTVIMNSTVNTK